MNSKHLLQEHPLEDDRSTSAGGSDTETHSGSGEDDAPRGAYKAPRGAPLPTKPLFATQRPLQLMTYAVPVFLAATLLITCTLASGEVELLSLLCDAAAATSTEIFLFGTAATVYGVLFRIRRLKEPMLQRSVETKKETIYKPPRCKKAQSSRSSPDNERQPASAAPLACQPADLPALTLADVGPPPGLEAPLESLPPGLDSSLDVLQPPPGLDTPFITLMGWAPTAPAGLEVLEAPPGLEGMLGWTDGDKEEVVFDVTAYRREVSSVLKDLANGGRGHNVAAAVQRIRACAVPEDRQAKEFCDILTRAAEEPRGAARRLAFAFAAGLGASKGPSATNLSAFSREECVSGLQLFFADVFEDLASEVPRLSQKISNEFAPALTAAFLTADELERLVPPDCRR